MIDVILTSFARWDLLRKTLDSFFRYKDFEINNFYIYDDKGIDNYTPSDYNNINEIREKYKEISIIIPKKRTGQIQAIDTLISKVTTPYFLHLEDDWECLQGGYINDAINILKYNPKCCCVWLRGIKKEDVNGHPLYLDPLDKVFKFSTNYKWKGYTFGVSVKRLSDYTLLAPFTKHTKFNPRSPHLSEYKIGLLYFKLGYYAATLVPQYFQHIGNNRGIRN